MEILIYTALVIIGFAGGIAVGSGFVAFITVLNIIPRLTQLVKGFKYLTLFQNGLIIGAVFFTWIDLRGINFDFPATVTLLIGAFSGIFIGMLAAALTEVLNVLPILAKRLNMTDAILFLLMAMVFGKILGSLFHLIIFVQN